MNTIKMQLLESQENNYKLINKIHHHEVYFSK